MQVADNQAVLDSDTAESHNGTTLEPGNDADGVEIEPQGGEVASTDHLAGERVGKPFEKGNQLWRRRGKAPGLQTSRRALREAFHKALTPEAMAACVAKMLAIIDSKDAKAAVQAFKVLTECAGVRGDSDGSRSGPSFTFILPGAGIIPERSSSPDIVAESDAVPVLESG